MKEIIKKWQEGGISILGMLILTVFIIITLSYFKIDIRSSIENEQTKSNFSYVGGAAKNVWDKYLQKPTTYIWNNIVINLFWKSFISNMERIRDGKSTDFELMAPNMTLLAPNQNL